MLVSKPHFISSQSSLPDYKDYIKEQGMMGYNQNSDTFATMLKSQNKYGDNPSNNALDMMKAGHDVAKLNESAINAAKGAAAQAQAQKAHYASSFSQNQHFFTNDKVNLRPNSQKGLNVNAQNNIARHVQERKQENHEKQDSLDVNLLAKIADNNRKLSENTALQSSASAKNNSANLAQHVNQANQESGKALIGIPLQREAISLARKPIGITPPAFTLDERSLATLSRVRKNKEKTLVSANEQEKNQMPLEVKNQKNANEVDLAKAQELGKVENNNNNYITQAKSKITTNPHTIDAQILNTPMGLHNKKKENRNFAQLDHDAFFKTKPIRQNIKDDTSYLGELSAKYESAKDGISAIGYDRVGGTSYGKYQIASNVGTFDQFVNFASKEAPDIAAKLRSGGEANTGSRYGKMPKIWREIASEHPERFNQLQENFIKKTHYDPTITALKEKGIEIESDTLKQVVWSTAVHHGSGGAKSIFDKAIASVGAENPKDLIAKVYDLRATRFSSSTTEVRQAVQNRLLAEKSVALAQLS